MSEWDTVGRIDPCALASERITLHHAVQPLAAFGQALVPARDDDSHRSMGWDPARNAFVSEASPDGLEAVVSLKPYRLELWADGARRAHAELASLSPAGALDWLGRAVGRPLAYPDWDLPERPGPHDAPLAIPEPALDELRRWYANAHGVLTELAHTLEGASGVRAWPHHFDLATLVTYPPAEPGGERRATGIGLSPGDADYPQPYLYVNAWPSPDPPTLGRLSGPGHWHTDGWTAAVLPAERVVEAAPDEQCPLVEAFVAEALAQARRALGVTV